MANGRKGAAKTVLIIYIRGNVNEVYISMVMEGEAKTEWTRIFMVCDLIVLTKIEVL